MKTHAQVLEEAIPIEVNQVWIGRDGKGNVLRKIRILAEYPERESGECDGRYLYEEMPSKMYRTISCRIGITPGYNLRRIFELTTQ